MRRWQSERLRWWWTFLPSSDCYLKPGWQIDHCLIASLAGWGGNSMPHSNKPCSLSISILKVCSQRKYFGCLWMWWRSGRSPHFAHSCFVWGCSPVNSQLPCFYRPIDKISCSRWCFSVFRLWTHRFTPPRYPFSDLYSFLSVAAQMKNMSEVTHLWLAKLFSLFCSSDLFLPQQLDWTCEL